MIKWKLTEEPVWYLKSIPYLQYLDSDHWKILKQKYIEVVLQNQPRCEQCGIRWIGKRDEIVEENLEDGSCTVESHPRAPRFNLHHKSYENLGEENLEDVGLMCSMCHNLEHRPTSHAAKHWAEIVGTERVFPLVIEPW